MVRTNWLLSSLFTKKGVALAWTVATICALSPVPVEPIQYILEVVAGAVWLPLTILICIVLPASQEELQRIKLKL